jgi:hypothetical protein
MISVDLEILKNKLHPYIHRGTKSYERTDRLHALKIKLNLIEPWIDRELSNQSIAGKRARVPYPQNKKFSKVWMDRYSRTSHVARSRAGQ